MTMLRHARLPLRLALAALLCHVPDRTEAHEIFGITGLPAMVLHPLLTLDLLVCLIAIGLLTGPRPSPGVTGALMLAAAGIVAGHLGQALVFHVRGLWRLPFAAAALASLLVAAGVRLRVPISAALILMLGTIVGLGIVAHAPGPGARLEALVGGVIAAALPVAVLGLLIGQLRHWLVQIGMRVLGAWIAAIAILSLALPGA
jgi:hypothetical protein